MKTFADLAAQKSRRVDQFAQWRASDPELGTVHQMRDLRACEACRRMSSRTSLIELEPKMKRGSAGRYIHGYCYAVRHGLAAFKNLPAAGGLSQVTLDEFLALGLSGRKFRPMIARAERRRGVILTKSHARAGYCTERVNQPESVLGRECYRMATTTSNDGKPVCAWHVSGRTYRGAKPRDIEIRGKLGTHPTALYLVQDSDEAPLAGDRVMVISNQDRRVARWTEVRIVEIRFGNFFYLEMV